MILGEQHEILYNDAWAATERLKDDDSQTNRRALVHAVSAYIEGSASGLRQSTLETDDDLHVLTEGDRYMLLDRGYRLDDRGNVLESNTYQPFKNTLLFTFVSFAKVFGLKYKVDLSTSGWAAMRRFVELRNRMTHPKSAADLECSYDDITDTRDAFEWFHNVIVDISKNIPDV
ncbi:MAG: hypothetical protein HUJ31_19900 [Pseudomonadales bacterium]|nr:hypothetical protein [Pseudomonadales bacterium]